MRQFVHQHRLLRFGGSGLGDEQFLLVVIVEGGGLLGEQVHGVLGEVEIGGHESELLQCQLFGADLLRLSHFLDALLEKLVHLGFGDEAAGDAVLQLQPGDFLQVGGDGVNTGEEVSGGRLGGCGLQEEQDEGGAEAQQTAGGGGEKQVKSQKAKVKRQK